ncbi:hypothetical protein QNM99_00380 [Pseudomonas sp. PCH446]
MRQPRQGPDTFRATVGVARQVQGQEQIKDRIVGRSRRSRSRPTRASGQPPVEKPRVL